MKKLILVTALLTLSSIASARGGFYNKNYEHCQYYNMQQGFYDEKATIKTVKEALDAKDNTFVSLEGSIIKQLDDDEFLFKDATGEVEIDLDRRVWRGQTITPEDKIRIHGKVDKDWGKTEIDVKQITKL